MVLVRQALLMALALAAPASLGGMPALAQGAAEPVRLGVLDDMSSVFADQQGQGDVVGAQLAIDDFGGKVLGRPIELLSADLQNKPDVGVAIAREWYDVKNVSMITGVGNSAVALALQPLTREKNRVQINTAAGTAELTNKSCTTNSAHWVFDTYSLSKVTTESTVKAGGTSWYYVAPDYAFGQALVADSAKVVKDNGGTVVGTVMHPLNTPDYSSFLLQAQGSKAKVVALAMSGDDMINAVKQSAEFGISQGQQVVALIALVTNIRSIGLPLAKGLRFTEAFYWDQNDETRAFSKRFAAKYKNRPPTSFQAGAYSATLHYLKAVQAAGTLDGLKVMEKMREIPVNDFMTQNGHLREDGRLMRDMYLLEAKQPEESKSEWDLLKVVAKVSAENAYRPVSESACPLLKK